jgi:hypothetical protein
MVRSPLRFSCNANTPASRILSKSVQPVSVSFICFTRDKATTARAYVQLALGVSAQIVIPRGMPRTSVIRSNQHYVTTVSEVSDRHFSSFATPSAYRSQNRHWQRNTELQASARGFDQWRLERNHVLAFVSRRAAIPRTPMPVLFTR